VKARPVALISVLGSEKSAPTTPGSFSKIALPGLVGPYDFSATKEADTVMPRQAVRSCAFTPELRVRKPGGLVSR